MNNRSNPLGCSNLLAGIIITVIGGLILALILAIVNRYNANPPSSNAVASAVLGLVAEPTQPITTPATDAAIDVALPTNELDPAPTVVEQPTPIPLPYVPNTLPWSDDFSGPLRPEWLIAAGNWRTENGLLMPGNSGGFIVVGSPLWDDYIVRVDAYARARGVMGTAHKTEIRVRMQDMRSYASFVIDCEEGTWWEISRNGQAERVVGTFKATNLACGEVNLELRVVGDGYEAYANGELHSAFRDSLFSSGFIGLSTQIRSFEGAGMNFDNLVVSAP